MINRLKLATSKLIFCLQVTADPISFFKLIWNTKRLKRHKKFQSRTSHNHTAVRYKIKINARKYNIHLRTFKGDIDIFYEVFWKQVYKLPNEIDKANCVFIDAGANIGMATLYFKAFYNPSHIVSIEPASDNFDLLVKNTTDVENISLMHAAVMAQDGWVTMQEEFLHYNNKATVVKDGTVKAVTFHTILRQFNIETVDILKIDIEGEEEKIFLEDSSFLKSINNAVVEIHTAPDESTCLMGLKQYAFTIIKVKNEFDTDTVFWAKRS
jgi:FkbM family methyltransferase